jgi:hypothetical protein
MFSRYIKILLTFFGGTRSAVNENQIGGVNVSGQIEKACDIVGRDKVINVTLIEDDEKYQIIKSAIELIRSTNEVLRDKLATSTDGAMGKNAKSVNFWLKEVIEPLHLAMTNIDDIYMSTFYRAEEMLMKEGYHFIKEDNSGFDSVLEYMTRRHRETKIVRSNLLGMRRSIESIGNKPAGVDAYVAECENYFEQGNTIGFSTPMRGLLDRLEQIKQTSCGSKFRVINEMYGDVNQEALASIRFATMKLVEAWPNVAYSYHTCRLTLLGQLSIADDVGRLLFTESDLRKQRHIYSVRGNLNDDKYKDKRSEVAERLEKVRSDLQELTRQ